MDGPAPQSEARRIGLRAELATFIDVCGARWIVAPAFHLGVLGGRRGRDQIAVIEGEGFDQSVRTDLVDRCLTQVTPTDGLPIPWLTRSGTLVPQDVDMAWAAAAREAYGRHGVAFPGFYVITRQGWLDLDASLAVEETVPRRRRR